MLDFLFPAIEYPKLTAHPQMIHTSGALERVFAATSYQNDPDLRRLIQEYKYGRVRSLEPLLTQLLIAAVGNTFPLQLDTVLCPVPMFWVRKFRRGFNQAERLALALASEFDLPVAHLLSRSRSTGTQTKRTRSERFAALTGAFVMREAPPLHVTLVDDLRTTGATMEECARTLCAAGVHHVDGIVLAHG